MAGWAKYSQGSRTPTSFVSCFQLPMWDLLASSASAGTKTGAARQQLPHSYTAAGTRGAPPQPQIPPSSPKLCMKTCTEPAVALTGLGTALIAERRKSSRGRCYQVHSGAGCMGWKPSARHPSIRPLPMQKKPHFRVQFQFKQMSWNKNPYKLIRNGFFFPQINICRIHCNILVEQLYYFLVQPRQLLFITNWSSLSFCPDENIRSLRCGECVPLPGTKGTSVSC